MMLYDALKTCLIVVEQCTKSKVGITVLGLVQKFALCQVPPIMVTVPLPGVSWLPPHSHRVNVDYSAILVNGSEISEQTRQKGLQYAVEQQSNVNKEDIQIQAKTLRSYCY